MPAESGRCLPPKCKEDRALDNPRAISGNKCGLLR